MTSQPLRAGAPGRANGADQNVHAECDEVGIAKVSLGQMLPKVRLVAVMVDAAHAASEDIELDLKRSGFDGRVDVIDVETPPVRGPAVIGSNVADAQIVGIFISQDTGFNGHVWRRPP